jgi:hypothetical protein
MGEEARQQPRLVTAPFVWNAAHGGSVRKVLLASLSCPALCLFAIRSSAEVKGAVSPVSALTAAPCIVKFESRYVGGTPTTPGAKRVLCFTKVMGIKVVLASLQLSNARPSHVRAFATIVA